MPKLSKIEKEKIYKEMFKRMSNEVMDIIVLHEKLVDNSDDLHTNDFQPLIIDMSFRIIAAVILNHGFKSQYGRKKLTKDIIDSFSKCLPKLIKAIELEIKLENVSEPKSTI